MGHHYHPCPTRQAGLLDFLWGMTTLILLTMTPCVSSQTEVLKTDWYTRYPSYPNYCSTPDQMKARTIPEIDPKKSKIGDSKLVHVTAVLRHGARTILGTHSPLDHQCWDHYWENPETGKWDCSLNTLVMPPSPERIIQEEGDNEKDAIVTPYSMFFFDKVYDSLKKPQSNVLNGTCQEGQLILQGYEQQVGNGKLLRDTYLYQESENNDNNNNIKNQDERLRLFDISPSSSAEPWDETNLYLRSDDEQRTLMSGQLLMLGMLENELIAHKEQDFYGPQAFPTVPVHTADRPKDILNGLEEENCPRLAAIRDTSERSREYKKFYHSEESKQVRDFMESQATHDDPGLFDCLMTTVCTDRPLPEKFGIYNPQPNNWFNRIADYHVKNHTFHLLYNDAEYSKLSMSSLWAEIFDHISPVLEEDQLNMNDRARPPAKLAIYSGYDSTIMQLLASLGAWEIDNEWPPYASIVLIEIHQLLDDGEADPSLFQSKFVFRLLYNGQVLTDKVPGCPADSELCDTQQLVSHIHGFADRFVDCVDPEAGKIHVVEVVISLLSKTGGIILALIIIGVSALIGSLGVFYYLTGTVPASELGVKIKHPRSRNDGLCDERPISGHRSSAVSDNVEMKLADADPYDEM